MCVERERLCGACPFFGCMRFTGARRFCRSDRSIRSKRRLAEPPVDVEVNPCAALKMQGGRRSAVTKCDHSVKVNALTYFQLGCLCSMRVLIIGRVWQQHSQQKRWRSTIRGESPHHPERPAAGATVGKKGGATRRAHPPACSSNSHTWVGCPRTAARNGGALGSLRTRGRRRQDRAPGQRPAEAQHLRPDQRDAAELG